MERVVAPSFVHELPDLKLAHLYRVVSLGMAAVHERLHVDCPSRLGIGVRERLDVARRARRRHPLGSCRSDADSLELFLLRYPLPSVVRETFDLDRFALVVRPHGELAPLT